MFVPAKQLGQLDSLHRKHYASSKLFNTQAGAIAGREDQRHQYDEKYPYFVYAKDDGTIQAERKGLHHHVQCWAEQGGQVRSKLLVSAIGI